MRFGATTLFILLGLIFTPLQNAFAAPRADVQNDRVTFAFPETATFSATLKSTAEITSVVLEYGTEQQTCGEVIAKAFPQFTPSNTVEAQWVWDMRQSGSLPPGAAIWWRWRYTDSSGAEFVSDQQTATWLDDVHDWQTVSSGNLSIHYYGKDQAFAQTMLDAGLEGLRRNKEQAGLVNEDAMNVYVYPSYSDMQEAVLYEPSWTGGQAYSDFNIVIMGISNSDSTWDKNTVIHELTHLLVGHFTFSCIGTLPGWIEEGLAMYSEGQLDAGMQSSLDQAVNNNTLITLRSLNGGFSELSDKANLSYSQSYSVIKFMIDTYGQQKMTDLLIALRDAKPIDEALLEVYGFNTDGLDAAWRESVGAAPLSVSSQATVQPTATFVPTYVPVSGAPLAITPTPFAVPTSSFDTTGLPPSRPPLSLTIALICFCLVFLILIGVIVLSVVVRSGNAKKNKGGQHE
jgi:hypothetical protein